MIMVHSLMSYFAFLGFASAGLFGFIWVCTALRVCWFYANYCRAQAREAFRMARKLRQRANAASNGWIACSERMPAALINVLVCDSDKNLFIRNHKHGFWNDYRVGHDRHEITHWQPLPAPPATTEK